MNVGAAVAISAAIRSSAIFASASNVELQLASDLALDVERLRLHIDREVVSPSSVRIHIEPLGQSGAHAEVEIERRMLQRDIDLADVKQADRERIIALAIGELLRGPSPREANADAQSPTNESTTNRRLHVGVLFGARAFPAFATYALEPRIFVSAPMTPWLEVTVGAMTMHTWRADILGDVHLHGLTLNAAAHLTHRISRTLSLAFGPRVDGGLALADATPRSSGQAFPTNAALWILTAEAGAFVDLSPRWRAAVNLDAGSTLRGLELRADDRASASFAGATAAAHVGIAFESP